MGRLPSVKSCRFGDTVSFCQSKSPLVTWVLIRSGLRGETLCSRNGSVEGLRSHRPQEALQMSFRPRSPLQPVASAPPKPLLPAFSGSVICPGWAPFPE
eukprot:5341359-Amphidinium_carterae.1